MAFKSFLNVPLPLYVIDVIMIVCSIQVDLLIPATTSECSNIRSKGFSVTTGQGDSWSME
jgi:hypothetical protein